MTIGQIAARTGVGVETVRFYERQGLIPEPPRRPSGYRQYPEGTVRRLRFIRRAKELGFSLREVHELLALRADSPELCHDLRQQAAAKLADLERRIADLERMRRALGELTRTCESHRGSGCPLLDALEESDFEGAGR